MTRSEHGNSGGPVMVALVLIVLLVVGGGAMYMMFKQAEGARRAAEVARAAEAQQRMRAEEARDMAEAAHMAEAQARLNAEESRRDAGTQQAKAEALAAFLADMLANADPSTAKPELTVREVLDAAGAKLDGPDKTDPAAEASLRAALAQAYSSLGLHDAAEKHLQRAIELRTQASGPDDPQVKDLQDRLDALRNSKPK